MKPADLKPLHAILFDRPGKVRTFKHTKQKSVLKAGLLRVNPTDGFLLPAAVSERTSAHEQTRSRCVSVSVVQTETADCERNFSSETKIKMSERECPCGSDPLNAGQRRREQNRNDDLCIGETSGLPSSVRALRGRGSTAL